MATVCAQVEQLCAQYMGRVCPQQVKRNPSAAVPAPGVYKRTLVVSLKSSAKEAEGGAESGVLRAHRATLPYNSIVTRRNVLDDTQELVLEVPVVERFLP